MAVTRLIEALEKIDSYPTREIVARMPAAIMRRLNALYEALADMPAPGAGSILYRGHDHGADGGGPIVRSSTLCLDGGAIPIVNSSLSSKDEVKSYVLGYRYIGPNLGSSDRSTFTDVAICIKSSDGACVVWAGPEESYGVTVDKATGARWLTLSCPIVNDDGWHKLSISIKSTSEEAISVLIYALDEAETEAAPSLPRVGQRELTKSLGAVGSVLEYFGTDATLDDDFVAALGTLDSYTLKILMWSLNALYSHTMDRSPPGKGSPAIKGHDHLKIASSGFGGRPIPKGRIYSAGAETWATLASSYWMKGDISTLSSWVYADSANTIRRSAGTPNATTGAGTGTQFETYITPGFTSSGNPPTSNPFLVAWIYVHPVFSSSAAGSTMDVRIYNATTGTLSPVVNKVAAFVDGAYTFDWIMITKIPCSSDAWNDFSIQVRATAGNADEYEVSGFVMAECYDDGTDDATVIDSSGTSVAGVVRPKKLNTPED